MSNWDRGPVDDRGGRHITTARDARPHRVFVLDSHTIFRTGVRSVLDGLPSVEVVGEHHDFAEGFQAIVETGPDVALVGIREAEHDLLRALSALREARPDVGVLVLTRTDDEDALAAAIEAGALGYLTKDLTVEELSSALDDVARGEQRVTSEHLGKQPVPAPEPLAPLPQLTAQEHRVLDLVAAGLTNKLIAERLFLGEKTVRNHITRILAKLGVERRTQAALVAVRHGLGASGDLGT
jgi:two-component system response regulator DevR